VTAATIVTIHQISTTKQLLASLRSPVMADGDLMCPLNLDPMALPLLSSPKLAAQYGADLRVALSQHTAIDRALDDLFVANPADPGILHFEIRAPMAETVRWEALCHANGAFLAVDSATPLGRIAGEARGDGDVRLLEGPLRIAAFLSPAGISAEAELDALVDAVTVARAAGCDLQLDAYLSENDLRQKKNQAIAAGQLKGVAVYPAPASASELEAALNDRPAQVIHFFCHGVATQSLQALEFGTIVDWEIGAEAGSVQLAIWRLLKLANLRKVWMIVLNCCEGSVSNGSIGSMAYRIVKEGGVPACVGMNAPIQHEDASLVTEHLYRTFFAELTPLFATDVPQTINFARAVAAPRQALRDHYAAATDDTCARWSLPALYTTGAALRAHRDINISAAQQIRLDTVADFLRGLPADTPDVVRKEALAMLAAIPEAMRPDKFGRFGAEA
jgi:hypothetical protein